MPASDDTPAHALFPIFENGPWKTRERTQAGDIVETKFDGERVGQRTFHDREGYRADLRDMRGEYKGSNGFSKNRDLRHIGAIPLFVWMKWCRKYGAQNLHKDKKLLKRLIRDYNVNVVAPGSF